MVATDTVVGIVGAVVLAAVMVGVFVYEYNNAPTELPGGNGDGDGRLAAFRTHYPLLNASSDLDGDGQPNLDDPDLDGDGVGNGNDTTVAVVVPFSGTMAPGAAPVTQPHEFAVHPGMAGLEVVLFYNSTAPSPLPSTPAISFVVEGPGGSIGSSNAPAPPAGSTAYRPAFSTPEPLEPGAYRVTVTGRGPGPSTVYHGRITISYGDGEAAHEGMQH
jgi:hypothetical protein